ncbi:SLC13 family permease [Abyssisolibacter fermentans]|uniref:SLC13 family permease n=1 Tax=Abyssisolibacter fermentans TaxID=1766203 RepID=UPI0008322AFF|nr:SLC13 family permease [Abyssisolibacter fermentans]
MSKEKIKSFLESQCVLIIAILLAVITSFFSTPSWDYLNFKVLVLLFNLMIVVAALNKCKVLDKTAITLLQKCTTYKKVSFALVFITFVAAMFVTNDVALITFIPFTIIVGKKANIKILNVVIFQTLAVNIGSSFTPMGNPQNLFIYSHYNMVPSEFLKITLPMVLVGAIFLWILILKEKDNQLDFKVQDIVLVDKYKIFITIILFAIIILSVFNIVDYKIIFALTVLIILIMDRKLFLKVDYSLLIIFIGFFVFIGNISQIEMVKEFIEKIFNSSANTYFGSILISQIISNVPATVLISGFTEYSKELLLAVNIGGMGTLIASLASLISYKLYVREYKEESNKFLQVFTIYNLIGLILFVPIIYVTMVK